MMKKKRSLFKEYGNYLRDNPKGYWFKRKLYGWGWMPVTLNGWAIVLLFLLYLILLAHELHISGGANIHWFFIKLIAAIAILIAICYKKGEKPKWMWGPPKKRSRK